MSKKSVQRGADSGEAAEFQPILSEKALEFTASFSRVLDLVVIGFATTDEKIAVQKVQVAIDWGRHAVRVIESQAGELAAAKAENSVLRRIPKEEVWYWQGDGYDFPESLTCPVIMSAEKLRAFLSQLAAAQGENDRLRQALERKAPGEYLVIQPAKQKGG